MTVDIRVSNASRICLPDIEPSAIVCSRNCHPSRKSLVVSLNYFVVEGDWVLEVPSHGGRPIAS